MGSANEEKGAIPPWSVARAVLGDLVEVLGGNRDNVGIGIGG